MLPSVTDNGGTILLGVREGGEGPRYVLLVASNIVLCPNRPPDALAADRLRIRIKEALVIHILTCFRISIGLVLDNLFMRVKHI
jgi:hypothetical protein